MAEGKPGSTPTTPQSPHSPRTSTISGCEDSDMRQTNVHNPTGPLIFSASNIIINYGMDHSKTAAGSNEPCFPLDEMQYEYNRTNDRTGKETKHDYHELFKDPGLSTSAEYLFNAAAIGNTTKVQEIISKTPGLVKSQNKQEQTALHAAAYGGHLCAVDALVTNGAPLEQHDKEGYTALAFAVDGNEPQVVRYLLVAGSKVNMPLNNAMPLLHVATLKGHLKCVEELLERCDVNSKDGRGNTPLFIAMEKNWEPIIELLVGHPQADHTLKDDKHRNSLHLAAIRGNHFAVKRILEIAPELLNSTTDHHGYTALHMAAVNGRTDIVLTLVKQENCEKDLKDAGGDTALHLAIEKKHVTCIEVLLENGADVNVQNKDNDTCLHLVMMKMQKQIATIAELSRDGEPSFTTEKEMLKLLIECPGVDLRLKNDKGFNCLHFAALKGNNLAVEMILKVEPQLINVQTTNGFTALHIAAINGYTEAVLILVRQESCQKDLKDIKGDTALHLAIEKKHVTCIKALLENGADVNVQDKDNDTCTHLVMTKRQKKITAISMLFRDDEPSHATEEEMLKLLIERPGVDLSLKNDKGFNCLHFAALKGNNLAVEMILKVEPRLINVQTTDGFTALHIAAINGYTETVQILVKQESCQKDLKGIKGDTALHLAIQGKHVKCIKALLENGADVNVQDKENNTCLHLALEKTQKKITAISMLFQDDEPSHATEKEICALLIEHPGIDLTLKNDKGFNCLHFAALHENNTAIEMILKVEPLLINVQKTDGFTALHIAAINDHTETVRILVKQETCSKDLKTGKGETALHLATEKNHSECIKALVENGADVNAQDRDGNTILHRCMMSDTLGALNRSKLKDLTGSERTDTESKVSTIQLLLEHTKVDLDLENNKGFNCLHQAAFSGHCLGVEMILKAKPSLINCRRTDKTTALHIAACNGYYNIVKALVQQEDCCKDQKRLPDGYTPLHLAVEYVKHQCVRILLDNGADVNAQDKDDNTCLHLIVNSMEKDDEEKSEDKKKIIQLLVQHPKADLGLENNENWNCLQYSALKKNDFVVDQILKVNPSLINATGNENLTALHIAASNGFTDVLLALLQEKTCRKDTKSVSGQTALHLAVDKCYFECTKALLESDADVNGQDIDGNTSLHLVIERVSMKNISNPTRKSVKEDGAAHLATVKHNQEVITLLVEHPRVDLTLTNKTGMNYLHLAAINGNSFAVRIILKAKPTLVNRVFGKYRSTALHLAALNGHTDVVVALCEQESCEKDLPNVYGQTALHLATKCCNSNIAEILLNKGANVNAQDKDGDTCMHLLMTKAEDAGNVSVDTKQTIQLFVEHNNINLALENNKGDNCLHCAAYSGNNDAVGKILKASPWIINNTSHTFTALHFACLYGKDDVVQTLAKQGNCITDRQDENGQTALHLAIDKSHYKCIEALVNNGANVNTQDKDGNTCLHLVMMKESTRDMLSSMTREQMVDLAKQIAEESGIRYEKTNRIALIISLLKHGADVRKMNSKQQDVLHLFPNAEVESLMMEFSDR